MLALLLHFNYLPGLLFYLNISIFYLLLPIFGPDLDFSKHLSDARLIFLLHSLYLSRGALLQLM